MKADDPGAGTSGSAPVVVEHLASEATDHDGRPADEGGRERVTEGGAYTQL